MQKAFEADNLQCICNKKKISSDQRTEKNFIMQYNYHYIITFKEIATYTLFILHCLR